MSLFRCEQCGCVENTSSAHYWGRGTSERGKAGDLRKLCSECEPSIGKWHGRFLKKSAAGMCIGADGYLYGQSDVDAGRVHFTKIVGKVPPDED